MPPGLHHVLVGRHAQRDNASGVADDHQAGGTLVHVVLQKRKHAAGQQSISKCKCVRSDIIATGMWFAAFKTVQTLLCSMQLPPKHLLRTLALRSK